MADAAARTEPASPRRRETARRHGEVVLSTEIAPAAVLLAVLVLSSFAAPALVQRSAQVLREWLAAAGPAAAHDDLAPSLAWRAGLALGAWLVPFALVAGTIGVAAVVAQVGWHPNPALVAPDARRLGLAAGWRRVGSLDAVASLAKAIVKVGLVGTLAWRVLARHAGATLDASSLPVDGVLALAGTGLRELGLALAAALLVVGAGDYAWARWRHERRLRMSRHELREERRQDDGDPQVRQRFRRAHRELAGRRMLADVARADVVVTGAAQVAVALRYRASESSAPRVLAKGTGAVGRKIADAARAAGVPLVERPTLARMLVRSAAIGGEVAPSLYRAVAELIAWVYARTGQGMRP